MVTFREINTVISLVSRRHFLSPVSLVDLPERTYSEKITNTNDEYRYYKKNKPAGHELVQTWTSNLKLESVTECAKGT